MSYWLGIDVGSTFTTAALCREQAGQQAQLEVISLGARSAAVPSVVYLGPDGEVVVGEAAERRVATDPDRVVRDATRHALLVRWIVDLVVQREGIAAQGITLTRPAGWTAVDIQAVVDALAAAELPMVRFCSGPEAAAAGYSIRERSAVGATIAVYDLGGGTFEAAVIRKTGTGSFVTLGIPERIERLGGTAFDDAVFGHVRTAVPALRELESGATETARFKRSLALCQRDCTEAKEALSVQTEVTISVLLPQVQTQVRLSRAEFEDLIRPRIQQTVEALRRTLRSAGLDPAELDTVLLIGGSSRVPLVAQLLSTELGRPVAVDADPQVMIVLGAAVSGLATAAAYSADLDSADLDSAGLDNAGLDNVGLDSAGLATVSFDSVGADTAGPGSAMPVPATAGTPSLAGVGGPQPARTELPPWLTAGPPEAVPVEVQPAEVQWQRQSPRRIPRFAAAGLIGLVLLGGVVSVPFIMSANRAPVPAVPALAPPAPRLPAEAPADQNPVVSNPVPPDPAVSDPAVSNPVVSDRPAPAPAVPDPNAASADPGLATPAEPAKPPAGSRAATPNNGSRPASRPKPPATPPPPPPPPPRNVPDWVETARS
ncbi:MAG: Hsp70 family protein [Pseudonocardiaceae bacterium]